MWHKGDMEGRDTEGTWEGIEEEVRRGNVEGKWRGQRGHGADMEGTG